MLRYIFRIFRRKTEGVKEDWVDYMHRATRRIEHLTKELEMTSWVETHRRQKWSLAGKLARITDERWLRVILDWKPNGGVCRSRGHPSTRWTDQLESFAGSEWKGAAADADHWDLLEDAFVEHCG